MMATVLILEDEPYTLEFLEVFLSKHPLVDKVIGVNNSLSAVTAAKDYLPRIALLDIELAPDDSYNGIQSAKMITKISPHTACVFLTGYGKYALEAYSAHPYDFLLKPINKEQLNDLVTEIISRRIPNKIISKIPFRVKDATILLNPDSIACIERDGKSTVIYADQGSYETSYSLNELENLLPEQFARVHNSYIINLSRIQMIRYTNSRNYEVILENCPLTPCMNKKKYEEYKHLFTLS